MRDLLPFFVVAAAAVALFSVSLVAAVEAQSSPETIASASSAFPRMVSPDTPLNILTLRQLPMALLERATPLALLAGTLLVLFFAFKVFLGRRLLPKEWEFDPPWTGVDVLDIAAIAILLLVALQFFFPKDPHTSTGAGTWAAELIFRVLLAAAILVIVRYRSQLLGRDVRAFQAVGLRKNRLGRNIRLGVVAFLCFLAFGFAIGYIQNWFVQHFELKVIPQQPVELMRSAHTLATQIALPILAVIIAPFAEELFFRGFLQGLLRKHCGSNLAIFGTALFFASAHTNVFLFLPLFVLGLMLGYLYDRTQSLAAPIAMHFCQNAVTLCVTVASRLTQT
jgi:membrane protease YdiL (CAAX protease family)